MLPRLIVASEAAETAAVLEAAKEIEARAAKRAAEEEKARAKAAAVEEKARAKAAKPKPTRKRKAAVAIDAPNEQDDLGSQDEDETVQ